MHDLLAARLDDNSSCSGLETSRTRKGVMPNSFAYLILFTWPFVALVLFRYLSIEKALIWTILGGYLVLPSATFIKLPVIPQLDKHSIATLSALIGCIVFAPRSPPPTDRSRPGTRGPNEVITTVLLAALMGSPFLTALMNPDPIVAGPLYIPGLRLYDGFSMLSGIAVMVMPFFLAKRYLNTTEAHREVLRAFVLGGLIYSLLALVEVRLSPQLHTWVYGFFPHEFVQHIRAGGFRPVVFLNHGLMVGIFFCISILSALTLWRAARREGKPAFMWLLAALWLTLTLVLAKSVGALAIALVLGLVLGLGQRRLQLGVAVTVGVMVLFYPMLRGAGYIPVDEVYDLALSYSEQRAQSLKVRLDNETALLAHANARPWSGWGSWGRNQLYDSETGWMISVTDGLWVILIGVYGWTGYLAHFGLLTMPIFAYARRRIGGDPLLITSGLVIAIAAILIDFLPNAGMVPYVWMMTGALTGYVTKPSEAGETVVHEDPPNFSRPLTVLHGQQFPRWRTGSPN